MKGPGLNLATYYEIGHIGGNLDIPRKLCIYEQESSAVTGPFSLSCIRTQVLAAAKSGNVTLNSIHVHSLVVPFYSGRHVQPYSNAHCNTSPD